MTVLFHWEPNGRFLKPLIALQEKAVTFQSHYHDPTKLEPLAAGVPLNVESLHHMDREGPLLLEGDEVISGSFFLLEFIDEYYPGPALQPADPYLHYQLQELTQRMDFSLGVQVPLLGCARYLAPALRERDQQSLPGLLQNLVPVERRLVWESVFSMPDYHTILAAATEELHPVISELETSLRKAPWLVGDTYTIADIDIFSHLRNLPELCPQLVNPKETPAITDFLDRIHARPAVQAALALRRSDHPERCFVPGPEPSRWLGL